MSVMTIRTLHGAFQNLMVEWLVELMLHFTVASLAQLRLTGFQHLDRRETRLLSIGCRDKRVRTRHILSRSLTMR